MIDDYDAEKLLASINSVSEAEASLSAAIQERDKQIRTMLSNGSMPTEIGRIAGMSRARIYQIRDRRR